MTNGFMFNGKVTAVTDIRMQNDTVLSLWRSFCLGEGMLDCREGEPLTFRIGDTSIPTLSPDAEYALTVDENGAAVRGKDYGGLLRGFISLLMKIEYTPAPSHYTAFGNSGEAERLLSALAEGTVMVDWQYGVGTAPFETGMYLKDQPLDLLVAPWLDAKNYTAAIDTVKDNALFGLMLTTWHTLQTQMPGILGCAKLCGAVTFPWSASGGDREETATLLRRVSFEGNTYHDSGWSKRQIEV